MNWADLIKEGKKHSSDIAAAFLVFALSMAVFGYDAGSLGIYADDAGFLLRIGSHMAANDLLAAIGSYVTGRNLHMLWQYGVTLLAGGNSIENVPAMHLIHAMGDAMNGVALFLVLRLWKAPVPAAFFAAIVFSLFPNHGETHFWLATLPMNVFSTFFVLALLGLSTLLLRATAAGNRTSILLLVPLILISFVSAMFTYDQAVPVAMATVTALSAILIYRHRSYWPTISLFLGLHLATFVVLVAWKVSNPGGGPSFANLTFAHVHATYLQSLRIWQSAWLHPSTPQVLASAYRTEHGLPLFLSGIVLVALLIFLRQNRPRPVSWWEMFSGEGLRNCLYIALLLCGGLLFSFLAYLPVYLWYLSSRHSYLPSVGIAMMLAAVGSVLTGILRRAPLIALVLLPLLGVQLADYATDNLVEKQSWITSYAMRKSIYQDVASRYASSNPTVALFVGFPLAPSPATPPMSFMTGEQGAALSLITKGKIVANSVALHPVPSMNGYFIKTEEGRWGDNAVIHIARSEATVILFESIEGNRLNVTYDAERRSFSHERYYTLTQLDARGAVTAGALEAQAAGQGYDVQIPGIALRPNETLALIASEVRAGTLSPIFCACESDMEKFVIPVDVSGSRQGTKGSFHVEYQVSLPGVGGFRLYLVDHEKQRLLTETLLR